MKQKLGDPVIAEVREVRHRISARFDHGPTKLVVFYIDRQRQYQDQLIKVTEDVERSDNPAA